MKKKTIDLNLSANCWSIPDDGWSEPAKTSFNQRNKSIRNTTVGVDSSGWQ